MSVAEVVSIVGVCVVGVGLVCTWVRNGRGQSRHQGALEADVIHIKDKIDDEHTGLGAIKQSVDNQAVHCAKISSGFEERIKNLGG